MSDHLTYDEALALIDAPENRNRRKDKRAIDIGVFYPFRRYVWLEHRPAYLSLPERVDVTLYGNRIAEITPEGVRVWTCGYYTPSTRAALEVIFGRRVVMQTPGSRGGKWEPTDEYRDRCFIGGVEVTEGHFFPAKQEAVA